MPDSTVSDNYMEKSWNKFSKISNLPILNNKIKKEKPGKHWKDDGTSSINNSTPSLHITAYENSSESVLFDSFNDKENDLKNDKFGSIKKHEILDTSMFFTQNSSEFPRQQNYEVPEPEVYQYKASQRLLNPNEASVIVRQAGTVTEIWMFLWFLLFVVSTGVMISITCKKRPSTSKKQQKQKNNNVESNKSKKCDVKDGQNGGEKDLTIKEIAAAPSNAIIPPQDEKQNVKDESRKEKVNEDLEGPSKKELYATPGPSNILPKLDPAEIKEASEVFPVASLKKEIVSHDRSADKMSMENTLKEVPRRMPETDIVHDKDSAAQVFTNDQLL